MTKASQAYSRYLQTGQRFNRLVALVPDGYESSGSRRKALWRFRCDCGNEITVRSESVKSGNTKSCGCQKRDAAAKMGQANATHGLEHTRLYRIWRAMIRRCEYPQNSRYEYYGGRGIRVCDEWHSIHRFFEWALANGYTDDLTIDRYPDQNGNYEPSNCRWVTIQAQQSNRRPRGA